MISRKLCILGFLYYNIEKKSRSHKFFIEGNRENAYTVWNFKYFSTTQILREIGFGTLGKRQTLTILEQVN